MASSGHLVIFDCDGVLVDSEPVSVRVLVNALRRKGVDMDEAEAYRRFLGETLLAFPGVRETRTYAVMEEVKRDAPLPV